MVIYVETSTWKQVTRFSDLMETSETES